MAPPCQAGRMPFTTEPTSSSPKVTIFYASGIDKLEVKINRAHAEEGRLFTQLNVLTAP